MVFSNFWHIFFFFFLLGGKDTGTPKPTTKPKQLNPLLLNPQSKENGTIAIAFYIFIQPSIKLLFSTLAPPCFTLLLCVPGHMGHSPCDSWFFSVRCAKGCRVPPLCLHYLGLHFIVLLASLQMGSRVVPLQRQSHHYPVCCPRGPESELGWGVSLCWPH